VTPGTVAVCPPLPPAPAAAAAQLADLADALLEDPRLAGAKVLLPLVPDPGPDDDRRTVNAHWVAHLAIGLATGGAVAPVLLVLIGSAGELAPALGFSQKASRRAVSGYVLVDAVVPPAESRGGDWPDAPVAYLASPAADPLQVNQARLRGWDVLEVPDGSAATVGGAVAGLATR
jgi:hypothetical protein